MCTRYFSVSETLPGMYSDSDSGTWLPDGAFDMSSIALPLAMNCCRAT